MRNKASVSSDEASVLILCSHWMIADAVCSAMPSLISWWVNFFLTLFITFRTNVQMSIIPSPCWFFFALHLQWSLNLSTGKKSNAICIFASLCSTLFSLWFKFSLAWFYFLSKCTEKRAKADREKLKCRQTVLQRCKPYFLMLLCLT